ncbi:MAG: glutamate--tRNA ligase, partial [bacterium]
MKEEVRVRFAPSPTGYLHIGGVRTALFNWLFARHHGGKFILRLEDTDSERSTEEAVGWILDGLEWLHLDWDEGPFRQTDRFDLYQEHIDKLLSEGKAYPCYCAPEELEQRRSEAMAKGQPAKYDGRCRKLAEGEKTGEHTIRFKTPQAGNIVVNDLIRGKVIFDKDQMDDLIIRRSDKSPTYNLTVVVDDALMKITHVIRGEDHLSNTPRQMQMYYALGLEPPEFGHLPMILGPDKARLSKRHGAASVTAYRDQGYLWQAMINYLARLGWSFGDQEIFDQEELIEKFTLENVNRSAAIFDTDKLLWINSHYIKTLPADEIARLLVTHLEDHLGPEYTLPIEDPEWRKWLEKVVITLRERARTLDEMAAKAVFYFSESTDYEKDAAEKFLTPEVVPLLGKVKDLLESTDDFVEEALHERIKIFLDGEGKKLKAIAQPLRIALTYRKESP